MPLKRTNTRISKTTAFLTMLVIAIFVVLASVALKRSAERHRVPEPAAKSATNLSPNNQ